ncbi:MAG: DegT/DnrJ/EryC1/StrS family aminotransferase, partial [Rubrivivax sp.]|nr:DegT/DnrJ/EryC1/StrS family aminotransferase [Rubrivivax sp.]
TGEGGMVTTQDAALAATADQLRNHGASISEEQRHNGPKPYLLAEFNMLGFNYRMTDLQGAVGLVQLAKLDRFIDERDRWASWYMEQLAGIPWLRMPQRSAHGKHAWQAFVTTVDPALAPLPRNQIMEILQQQGIATRPGTHAVHLLGCYRDRYGLKPDDLPGARDCDAHTMAIPLHNRMSADDYAYVVEALRGIG